jgi:VanZ family protein
LRKSLPIQSNNVRPADQIDLTIPVIFLVLAATAIPVEFRPLEEAKVSFTVDDFSDVLTNVVGYVPVGIVLGRFNLLRTVLIAGLISVFAETSQLVMAYRDPSLSDVVSNVVGAVLGYFLSVFWKIRVPAFRATRWRAVLAALLALSVMLWVLAVRGDPVNVRGDTSPGTLEASWKLDESDGTSAWDYSGHELLGKFPREPKRVATVMGRAPVFDGTNYINFGRSTTLRFARSMTISAWINSSSYPAGDAVIVSQLLWNRGYQLDTTIDRGPRTIGFKLTDACGKLMIRYGATPLLLDTWYHVAGVYDAASKTLDVYLNGELDNGFLLGSVTSLQRSSRGTIYAGKRPYTSENNFLGILSGIRIYSFALTKSQIEADMRGEAVHATTTPMATDHPPCAEAQDKAIPALAAVLGTLVAIFCIGFWPSVGRPLTLVLSLAAAFPLLMATTYKMPAFNSWLLPLVTLAGAASVVFSMHGKLD